LHEPGKECHILGENILLGGFCQVPLKELDDLEVLQFTGLKDSTGKEIYEADIVSYEPMVCVDRIGTVEWSDYYNGWSIRDKECYPLSDFGVYSLQSPFLSFSYTKIIGNIFENPELLDRKDP
jgi:uncharacterized phage protein (TIGR01671 family)